MFVLCVAVQKTTAGFQTATRTWIGAGGTACNQVSHFSVHCRCCVCNDDQRTHLSKTPGKRSAAAIADSDIAVNADVCGPAMDRLGRPSNHWRQPALDQDKFDQGNQERDLRLLPWWRNLDIVVGNVRMGRRLPGHRFTCFSGTAVEGAGSIITAGVSAGLFSRLKGHWTTAENAFALALATGIARAICESVDD